jgi:Protein of unknown function (DUF4230)
MPVERKFMKMIVRLIAAGLLVLLGGVLGWWVHEWRPTTSQPSLAIDSGPALEQIQTLASLTTLRVNVADAIVTKLEGRTGGMTAVLVVHGSVTLGVDLSQARFESVDQRNHKVILLLPAPTIQTVSLDQQRTRIVALCDNGLWVIVPGHAEVDVAVTNLAYREAEKVVSQAADDRELMDRARGQAEKVLQIFLTAIGWTVEICWSGGPASAPATGRDRSGVNADRNHSSTAFFVSYCRVRRF